MTEARSGTKLADRYRLERELGRGGMGAVWAAQDEKLRRPIAVKLMASYLADSESALRRFEILREEADDVIVTVFNLNRSLCVLLSQDGGQLGDGGSPMRCARVNGEIKFPGDWCAATNSGADPACHDAMQLGMNVAASAAISNP